MRIFLLGLAICIAFGLCARYYAVQHLWRSRNTVTLNDHKAVNNSTLIRDNTLTLYYRDSLLLGGYEVFAIDSSQKLDISMNNRQFIEKTIQFLSKNPNKKLLITATFQRNEPNSEQNESKGIERAAALRDYLVRVGLQINQIALNDVIINSEPSFQFEILDENTPSMRFDKEEMTFFDDNFLEHTATFRPKISFTKYINSAKQHIATHPNSHLDLTVFIDGNDTATAEEFAISRAEAIKNNIVALGLIAYKIKINIKINDALLVNDNSYDATLKNHRFVCKIVY